MPAKVKLVTAQKDYPQFGIKWGEKHYFWQLFINGRGVVRRSKTPPRPSQLESSEYLISYYQLKEEAEDLSKLPLDAFDLEDFAARVQELQSDVSEKLSNMPDQLQQSETGQLMQERIDELEEWLIALNAIESDIDTDSEDCSPPEEQRATLLSETL